MLLESLCDQVRGSVLIPDRVVGSPLSRWAEEAVACAATRIPTDEYHEETEFPSLLDYLIEGPNRGIRDAAIDW